jgi:hypothetical protein
MTETVIDRGRWYPSPAPALDGESDDAYTDRLTGADQAGRQPYDHPRNRQCSIGWHRECSDPAGEHCKCPCHADKVPPGITEHLSASLLAGAQRLGDLYALPGATGIRVMDCAEKAAEGGAEASPALLTASLELAYGSKQADGFITDAVNIYRAAVAEMAPASAHPPARPPDERLTR